LLQRGVASLSDAELLAIFLRTGIKGKTAVFKIMVFHSIRYYYYWTNTRPQDW